MSRVIYWGNRITVKNTLVFMFSFSDMIVRERTIHGGLRCMILGSGLVFQSFAFPPAECQGHSHRRSIGGEQSQMPRSHPENVRLRGESGKAGSQIHIWRQGRKALLINHVKYIGVIPSSP